MRSSNTFCDSAFRPPHSALKKTPGPEPGRWKEHQLASLLSVIGIVRPVIPFVVIVVVALAPARRRRILGLQRDRILHLGYAWNGVGDFTGATLLLVCIDEAT